MSKLNSAHVPKSSAQSRSVEKTFTIEIQSDSVAPEFKTGDRVVIDQEITPRPGDYVVTAEGKHVGTVIERQRNYRTQQTFTVCGDKMMPTFNNKDVVLVNMDCHQFDEDGFYLVGSCLKRIVATKDGYEIRYDNPEYGPSQILSSEEMGEFPIRGRVVYKWQSVQP